MSRGNRIVMACVGGWMALLVTGCVSLDDHRRLEATNRNLAARNESLKGELFDVRSEADALRMQSDFRNSELASKQALIDNLRNENGLLDEIRRTAQGALDDMGKVNLGAITIAGPKLPPQLDSALKQFASAHPSAVEYDAQHGTVKWKSDLLFALGSDVVRETSFEALKQFSDIIKSQVAMEFEAIVVGHTDTRPIRKSVTKANHPTNWHLSAHRAIAVSRVLQNNGYPPERVSVMGCGEYRPIADNATAEGSSLNRRVEIYLVPRGAIVQAAASATTTKEGLASGGK